ncbi:MAG: SMC family ATPase [Clostridiales bacterium]|nr:SMC family ATPase [Clostridiales bacterium]
MRPIKLVIEGINSFDERQELDFERVGRSNLFCICGKTGAGKSTIFDCIMFALYGRSGRANLADVVNLSRNSAYVAFEFVERGDSYSVERTIKCTTQKSSDSTRVEKRTANSDCVLYKNGIIEANTRDGVAAVIEDIIGLDMGEFKNVYLLEQGEYAEFLKKPPAKQTEAVGKIFSLMRFAEVYKRAKEMAAAEEEKAATATAIIEEIGEDAPERLKSAKKTLTELKSKITASEKELQGKKEELDALEAKRLEFAAVVEKQKAVKLHAERLEQAELSREKAVQKLDEFMKTDPDSDKAKLKSLRDKLNAMTELNAQDKAYAAAEEELTIKLASVEKKSAAVTAAREKSEKLLSEAEAVYTHFDGAIARFISAANGLHEKSAGVQNAINAFDTPDRQMRINAVRDVISDLQDEKKDYDAFVAEKAKLSDKLTALSEEAKSLLEKIDLYSRGEKEKADEIERAKQDEKKAKDNLEAARLKSHAAAVREAINEGDTCPVCGGIYHGGGEHCDDGAVVAAKQEADRAEQAVRIAEEAFGEIKRFHEQAAESYNRIDGQMREMHADIGALDDKIMSTRVNPDVYKALAIAMKDAREYGAAFTQKSAELTKAAPALSALEAELKGEQNGAQEAQTKAEKLRIILGENCGKTAGLLAAVREEADALEEKVASADELKAELTADVEGAKGMVLTIRAMLDEAVKACPVDSPEFDEEMYNELKTRYDMAAVRKAEYERDAAVTDAAVAEFIGKAERLKNVIAERSAHYKQARCYGEIADLTYGKAMLNFVAIEHIEQFTAIASDILSELSDGKYTMSYDSDNGFTVSDFLNGGKVRKTDTLSGGEMFLASLSVAIAIARTQSKGNNGFFFLDEGFGTLDDELIDTVYGALESLSRDCLVGVISHSGSLIEHMPSCVTVEEATDGRGSRIVY